MARSDSPDIPPDLPEEAEQRDPSELSALIPRLYRRAPQPTPLFDTPFVLTYEEGDGWRGEIIGDAKDDAERGRGVRLYFNPEQLTACLHLPDWWYLIATGENKRSFVLKDERGGTLYYRGPGWRYQIQQDIERLTGMICEPIGARHEWFHEGRIRWRARQRGY